MATQTEGNIVYEVSLDTQNLIANSGKVREELLKLSDNGEKASKGLDKLDKSAVGAGNAMGKLTTIAKAVSAALVSSTVISYAESWNELEDRISNTGATAAQTKSIMDQLLATSNRNGRAIEESSELYIRLSNSMKELGYSTQGTLSYIDTLSNLLTIDKANALSAASAMNALTKAQMKGKLAGDDAMAVFNAMPSILKTLSTQLKLNEKGVRELAASGKLSMRDFTNAMIDAQASTAALADNMRNNLNDGFTRITNNLKQYFGEMNNATGTTKLFVDSLVVVSDHVDILATGVGVLAAVYAGKYITSLAAATKQSADKVIADIRLAAEEKKLAQKALEAASAERAYAATVQKSLVSQLELAKTEQARNAIRLQLSASSAALTTATNAEAAAQARLSAAMKATAVTTNVLKGAMNMLGGPAGVILIAVGALMSWASSAEQAKQKSLDLGDSINDLKSRFDSLSKAQQDLEMSNLQVKVDKLNTEIKEQSFLVGVAKKEYDDYVRRSKGGISSIFTSQEGLNEAQQKYRQTVADLATMEKNRASAIDFIAKKSEQASQSTDNLAGAAGKLNDEFRKDTIDSITKNTSKLAQETEIAQLKQEGLTKEAYIYQGVLSALGDESNKYKDSLLGVIAGTADMSELSKEQIAVLQPLISSLSKMYDINQQGAPKVKTATEKMKELKASLESLASPTEKENADYDKNKKILSDALKNDLIKQSKFNEKSINLEKEHKINLAKIKAEQVVSPEDQAAAIVDPVQKLKNENLQKIALIKEFEKQKFLTEQQSLLLMDAASTEYEQKRIEAQWDLWRNQNSTNELLASSLEGLASSATSTIAGLMSGTMSATAAMQNFANVILNEAVGSLVQMGLQSVKNAITSQTASATTTAAQVAEAATLTAAYTPAAMQASIASFGAAAIQGAASYSNAMCTMSAMSIAGGREHGGSVSGSSMYRVGEGNKPEILMAGGRQYMIPGESGKVISNKDIGSSSAQTSVNWSINIIGGDSSSTDVNVDDDQKRIDILINQTNKKIAGDIRERKGLVYNALKDTTNIKARL